MPRLRHDSFCGILHALRYTFFESSDTVAHPHLPL